MLVLRYMVMFSTFWKVLHIHIITADTHSIIHISYCSADNMNGIVQGEGK